MASDCASSKLLSVFLVVFNNTTETKNDTVAAAITDIITPSIEVFGVTANMAIIEPGEAGELKPEPKRVRVNTPVIPPKIMAIINLGFINTYGK